MDVNTLQKAMGLSASVAQRWCDPISASMALYDILTPQRQAMFLAQIGHETAGFVFTTELWGPTAQQLKYEPPSSVATSLGNTQPGDGYLFRGRGCIQITGRANYQQISNALGIDLVGSPDQLSTPSLAAQSAAWWWAQHNLNQYADQNTPDAFVQCTKVINGGTNGLADRQQRWALAQGVLGA